MAFVNPYYIPKQRSASKDFAWQPDFRMPDRPGGDIPQFSYKQPSLGQQASEWWGNNKEMMTTDKSGVGGIGAAVTSAMPSTADGDFSVDKNAGFKGSFKGLSQGGVVGAIAGGVMGQVSEFRGVNKKLDALQTGIEGVSYDENGRAVYNGSAVNEAYNTLDQLKKGEDSMKFGKGLDPATWAFGGIMGTRRRIRNRRRQLQQSVDKAQSEFNRADANTRSQMNSIEDYYQRMDPQARLYNIYKTQFS
jgi:hypothetical protein